MLKKIFFIFSILITISKSILANQPDRLDHLMFKPKAKQLITITNFASQEKKFQELDIANFPPQFMTSKISNFNITEIIDYGINDKLNIFLVLEYNQEKHERLNSKQNTKYEGLENPLIALKYRLLEQDKNLFNFDIFLPLSFDIINSKAADANTHTTGTVADGRDKYALRFDAGRYFGNLGALLGFGAEYLDTKKTTKTDGSLETASSSTDISYGLELQYIIPQGSIALQAARKKTGSFRNENYQKISMSDSKSYNITFNLSHLPRKYLFTLKLEKIFAGDITSNNIPILKNTSGENIITGFKYNF
jgi:hypothetical protein